jgi:mono/diheme cytochrome c family protein
MTESAGQKNSATFLQRAGFWPCLFVGLVCVGLACCSHFGSGLKAREIANGHLLFQMHCGGCHNGKKLSIGIQPPVLQGIFQRRFLPSGAPTTDSQVFATVLRGRSGIMPAFQNALSSQDIRDIIQYLHTTKPPQALESSESAP